MGYRSSRSGMLAACCCTVVLVGPHRGAAAFMLPSSVPLANSCSSSRSRSNRNSSPKPWLLDTPACSTIRAFSGPACAAVKQTRRTSRGIAGVVPLSASPIKGDSSSSSSSRGLNGRKPLPEPVMYAQEVLDRAWRSKRRIAAQGKGKPLKQRLMSAFGQTSAVFVDDREFMEETLDNVLRVSREREREREQRSGFDRAECGKVPQEIVAIEILVRSTISRRDPEIKFPSGTAAVQHDGIIFRTFVCRGKTLHNRPLPRVSMDGICAARRLYQHPDNGGLGSRSSRAFRKFLTWCLHLFVAK